MFLALEGADGVGKTTLCTILAERLGAKVYATPPKKYLRLREKVDKTASAQEHYYFYRDSTYDASDEIGEMLKNGCKVVSDRYWLTTYTYHKVMGIPVEMNDFGLVIKPNLTVILTLNSKVQIERILSRGISVGDHRVLDKQIDLSVAFYKNALALNIPFIALDTQRFSPDECADIVTAAVVK